MLLLFIKPTSQVQGKETWFWVKVPESLQCLNKWLFFLQTIRCWFSWPCYQFMLSFWKFLALTRETGECQKNFMNSLKCFQCTATLKTLDFHSTSEQRIFFCRFALHFGPCIGRFDVQTKEYEYYPAIIKLILSC